MIHRMVSGIGSYFIHSIRETGYTLALTARSLAWIRVIVRNRSVILELMYRSGVRAIPVVVVVGGFTGMILSLQTGINLLQYGQQQIMGGIVAVAMCREMGPFITGLILIATSGSVMAAELGTMKVSEEIDALEVMAVPPEKYLVLPRIIALTIVCPTLTILTDILGILGGALVARTQLGVSFEIYFDNAKEVLRTSYWFLGLPKDVYTGLFKAMVFGAMISAVGCARGLRTTGGALGVGRAARTSVLVSFLLIIIFGYFMSWMFYR